MTHIMDRTMEMREKSGRYVFLIKAATSETWWPEDADHIMFIRGRIGLISCGLFLLMIKQKPTGALLVLLQSLISHGAESVSATSAVPNWKKKGGRLWLWLNSPLVKSKQLQCRQLRNQQQHRKLSHEFGLEVGLVFNCGRR